MPKLNTRYALVSFGLVIGAILLAILINAARTKSRETFAPSPHPTENVDRIAFLAPASGARQNLWLLSPQEGQSAAPITFSTAGVYDFAVSPDGSQIAFSEATADGAGMSLRLLTLATGEITTLVDCLEAECTAPAWNPDGTRIAYERRERGDTPSAPGSTRVWLVDTRAPGELSRPLFADTALLSRTPVWSPDGTMLAVYADTEGGILLYDFSRSDTVFIPTVNGSVGAFSPDGTRLVFPEAVLMGSSSVNHLIVFDIATGSATQPYEPAAPLDDERAIWSPDGQTLTVGRRYMDDRHTPGRQIYRLSIETADTKPLVVDERYNNGYFEWDPTGQNLVIQRFQVPESGMAARDIRPEIWTYDAASGELTLLFSDAFLPQWVPGQGD